MGKCFTGLGSLGEANEMAIDDEYAPSGTG